MKSSTLPTKSTTPQETSTRPLEVGEFSTSRVVRGERLPIDVYVKRSGVPISFSEVDLETLEPEEDFHEGRYHITRYSGSRSTQIEVYVRVRDADEVRSYRYRSNVYTEELAFSAVKEAVRSARKKGL
jgi:hypothetical protein